MGKGFGLDFFFDDHLGFQFFRRERHPFPYHRYVHQFHFFFFLPFFLPLPFLFPLLFFLPLFLLDGGGPVDRDPVDQRVFPHLFRVESGGDHGDVDLAFFHLVVDDRSEDHLGVRVNAFGDYIGGLVYFQHSEVTRTGNIEEYALGPVHGKFQEGAVDGGLGGFGSPVIPTGHADSHKGRSAVMHDRAHIGEVDVYYSRLGDQIGNSLHTLS